MKQQTKKLNLIVKIYFILSIIFTSIALFFFVLGAFISKNTLNPFNISLFIGIYVFSIISSIGILFCKRWSIWTYLLISIIDLFTRIINHNYISALIKFVIIILIMYGTRNIWKSNSNKEDEEYIEEI
ncbi:hypothetical protein ACFIJ5_00680 [Haloimpatiens sp. FM7330]|uniref:hypothetical protein n=1 Tax=Haloimpatiens sp. FM7330 TaxID=3298610 RepID=UPI00362A6F3A